MFLSSPFPPVFSQKCLFFSVASPTPRKQGKNLPAVKISSYYLRIARKVVNSDCFVHKYTAVTSLISLNCKFFGLWIAGLKISVWKLGSYVLYYNFTVAQNLHIYFLPYSYSFWYNFYFCSISLLNEWCPEPWTFDPQALWLCSNDQSAMQN